jgi:tetratricopeptide (TPR) repeat protein
VLAAPAEPVEFAGVGEAVEWLDTERRNLLAATQWAVDQRAWPVAGQLSEAMWPLFLYRKHFGDWLEFDRLGLVAARGGGDRIAEARMLNRLGLACTELGRFAEAIDHHRTALAIWRDVGDRRKEAGTLRRLGFVRLAEGRYAEALALFEQNVAAFEELREPRRVALALVNCGRALLGLNRPQEALPVLERARSQLAGVSDPYNQADIQIVLGHAYRLTGDRDAAERLLTAALADMTELRSTAGTVRALEALADTAEDRGDIPVLLDRLQRAVELYEQLDLPEERDRVRSRIQAITTPPGP